MSDTSYSANNPTETNIQEDIMVAAEIGPMVAPGMVIPYAGNGDPIGYLLCDGRTIKRAEYPALFSAIGTLYGAGDGSTTFKIPNLVARFIEGSKTSGEIKAAGLPNITGIGPKFHAELWRPKRYSEGVHNDGAIVKGSTCGETSLTGTNDDNRAASYGWNLDASKSNNIYGNSETVQPPAITMRYCIRY